MGVSGKYDIHACTTTSKKTTHFVVSAAREEAVINERKVETSEWRPVIEDATGEGDPSVSPNANMKS